jgi:sulfide:quinone oxidoreductase
MPAITAVGRGFAALTAVRTSRKVVPHEHIDTVSPGPEFVYVPGLIRVPSGVRRAEDLRVLLDRFVRRTRVRHIATAAVGLAADGRTLRTGAGAIRNDGLLITSGGRFLKRSPGIEHAITPCEGIAPAERIRDRVAALSGGTIGVGFAANPREPTAVRGGPMFEFLFGIDRQPRGEGVAGASGSCCSALRRGRATG